MKVALSRAMLMRADIMLLDEPTNHLDVSNVAWVKEYLKSLKDVTCIMVSHDTGLLNDVCTHIIDIDSLKLHTVKGNLTEFVKYKPSAQQYFDIKKSNVEMKFPEPGKLEGVNSKGKPIMKMAGCTFTYPINQKGFVNPKTGIANAEDTPTLYDITIRCSLGSRVACVGKNGAGKSTMIKLCGSTRTAVLATSPSTLFTTSNSTWTRPRTSTSSGGLRPVTTRRTLPRLP
jgi:elongation factor 3